MTSTLPVIIILDSHRVQRSRDADSVHRNRIKTRLIQSEIMSSVYMSVARRIRI